MLESERWAENRGDDFGERCRTSRSHRMIHHLNILHPRVKGTLLPKQQRGAVVLASWRGSSA